MLFSAVTGQDDVRRRLLLAVQQDRTAHALLFAGPEGCGHLPMALAFARYLSCERRGAEDACGACPSCVKYNKLAHPDLHFSFPTAIVKKRPASSDEFLPEWRDAVLANPYLGLFDWYERIGIENKQGYMSVDESAAIQHKLSLKTYESPYKVMVIWMVEKMRTDAANKLLKLVEEPPDRTVFLLVTENPDLLPGTLVSRTQLIKFPRIGDDVMQKKLQAGFGLEYHEAHRIVRLADGNLNRAFALARREEGTLDLEKEFMEWMRMCFALSSGRSREQHYTKLVRWIDGIGKAGRERQKNFLHYGLEVMRDCILQNYGGEGLARLSDDLLPGFTRFAPFIHYDNAERFENELSKAYFHIERNANPRILFLDLSFRIHALLHSGKS